MKTKTLGIALSFVFAPFVQVFAGDGAQMYKQSCAPCHTIGNGKLVGPDLKDVYTRHSESWILNWVKSPKNLIESGDKEAVKLYNDFDKKGEMPEFGQTMTDEQINSILEFVKSGGVDENSSLLEQAARTGSDVKILPDYIDDYGNHMSGVAVHRGTHQSQQIESVPVRPAHIIIVMEENYSYSDIIGSSAAPNLTWLSKQPYVVNFSKMYAYTHPSEPNYLYFFSGSEQGVTADETGPDANAPFNNCNIGSSMIAKGYTFAGYGEDQPSVGMQMNDVPPYYTKHIPWINWMNGGNANCTADSIPQKDCMPMFPLGTYFPDSNHYSTLPTMSWVTPNIWDDMHDNPPSGGSPITYGDTWFKTNIFPLVRWAENPANNTLVIMTFDEDDELHGNNIPLLFCSGLCAGGVTNSSTYYFYDVMRTIEDMYGITTYCEPSSDNASDLPSTIWNITAVNSISAPVSSAVTWPVPAAGQLNVSVNSVNEDKAIISMIDITGRVVKEMPAALIAGENKFTIGTGDISNGVYFLTIRGEKTNISKEVEVQR